MIDNEIDTVFLLPDTILQPESKSFLNSTLSQPFEDRPLVLQKMDWFFIISILFLFFLALIRLNTRKSFSLSYRELVKKNSKYRTYNSGTHFSSSLFVICTCLVFSLAFFVFFKQLSEQANTRIFLWTFMMVLFFLFIRFVLLRMIGGLFNIKNIISEWENATVILNFTSAVLCFPFIFIAYYYSSLFLLVFPLLIFIVLFLFRFTRGWTIFRKGLRIHEYFLYLCSIEILPLLILLKLVTNRLLLF